MKDIGRTALKIGKYVLLGIAAVIVIFLLVRAVGQAVQNRTPAGGINESMYVEINGTEQWISIYGEDRDNPVLLYLHGGPGSATSHIDYAFTRKWADVYTVVTWDQRNCGKSYGRGETSADLTYDVMMDDGAAMTEFLLDHLSKEKNHASGTLLGYILRL